MNKTDEVKERRANMKKELTGTLKIHSENMCRSNKKLTVR